MTGAGRRARATPAGRRLPAAVRSLALAIAAAGCGDFVSFEDYDTIPPLAQLDFGSVEPGLPFDYWELREVDPAGTHAVVGSGGTQARDAIDPAVLQAFDAEAPPSGFSPHCPPGDCFRYFASILGTTIASWRTPVDAAGFLGTIGSRAAAVLLALANGYDWGSAPETGGIRDLPDGFELVLLKTVSLCDPLRTDRVVLRVLASAVLQVVKSEVWYSESGVCV